MTVHYQDESVTVHHGDNLQLLRAGRDLGYDYELGYEEHRLFPDSSMDAVVTDPPYGLEFMGKEWDGADGFRRSLNANDAGRDCVFGRTSRTSPEYRTDSKAQASRAQKGGHSATDGRPTFLGGLNPRCLACGKWQRGSNPCRCDKPEWTQERLVRLHSFQEWCEAWSRECLRVLKPGGHLLAFGGSRTYHRLACAIEDAGFEIRDSIAWLYGSGFPKSLAEHHRTHRRPPPGHKFSIGLAIDDELVGVAMIGRPRARHCDDGLTLEVNRTCIAGVVPNGNSMLYGAAWRAAKALGYTRLITYTQAGESGASLRAAGWRVIAQRKAHKGWDRPSRPRRAAGNEGVQRTLWEAA